jgi:ribulose kinase
MATVNYTPDQVETMVEMYQNGDTAADIADVVGKTTRSVIAKLSREGVYVAKVRVSGGRAIRKANIVALIANSVGSPLESLVKASKEDLSILATAVKSWVK